ncbi:Hypothetical protein LSL_0944 [Ligilactobacillus salivarius UCC118]|uniref:Uncharacterized protein n=1 Tax=Ligilactobacillus salivarius (strain UCC118) TaxID=362948 RepID=Q1WTJ2_LIGS1|nr:Hypothetical protein LSL_0944 [Ligilactobacillus salivarius UCC118]OQQ76541.1 hypothetical protein B6U64_05445 [Ligilactobacillus salivarius]OQQ81041.1 hypothetical protein B6U61_04230 [Ligilactobacillus salivarius]OQR20441.1 hypothetical protein B6U40_04850 [Ligilactobacillus salivarius]RHJ59092.1 hypothetical protein DW111_06100 [Ligilactobacillus salivarius]
MPFCRTLIAVYDICETASGKIPVKINGKHNKMTFKETREAYKKA